MMARQQGNRNSASPNTRQRAVEAYDNARERTRAQVEGSPLLALGGGLAIGAIFAALLPKTKVEDRLLGDVGGRINETARSAAEAAREAGRDKLAELNITREAGKGAVQSLLDGIGEAARTSSQAAIGAVRNKG